MKTAIESVFVVSILAVATPAQAVDPDGPNLTVTIFNAPSSAALDEQVGDLIRVRVANTGPSDIPAGTLAAIGFCVYGQRDHDLRHSATRRP